ncbi:MAG: acylase [Cyanophyceae cyanobacterium]
MIGKTSSEILWDTWGVPHIFSHDHPSLFRSFGWAQTQSHGNLILRLYGQARGKAAEYWGEDYFQSDQYVRTMGIPTRAQQWYEVQSPQMQEYLEAFAEGINRYVRENPNRIDKELQAVLPINGVDILAHMQRVIHFHFIINPLRLEAFQSQIAASAESDRLSPLLNLGSNAWAVAPSHSPDEQAMLLANPHLPWSDLFLLYEAHLNAPQINSYGATLVGMPFLAIAFNDDLGWTLTVNTFDGADIYELTLAEEGYLWDGEVRPFEVETQTIQVSANGTVREEPLTVRRSVHGPVIAQTETKAYALRVVGLDRPQLLEQFWQMAQATALAEWETALSSLQLPMFNLLYSDRQGHIFYVFNALVPVRTGTWEDWQGVIPGDTATTLWTDYHSYQDLPRLLDPESGWLQNTNDPPWTSTFPRLLDAQNYPAYFAPAALGNTNNIFRPQRSLKLLQSTLSFEEMIAKKFSSRLELADRLLDELIPAARLQANSLGLAAAEVLDSWDRQTNAESEGAVLFALWSLSLESTTLFATPWSSEAPLTTPDGIADLAGAVTALEQVAAQVQSLYGSLDVTWGEVVRLRYEGRDLPASGGPGQLGSFRVLEPVPAAEGFRVVAGDTYIAAIEFADPVRASALTAYGNATQPDSAHVGDQLPLYARGELRPVWRTRSEIEAHLEARQAFGSSR